MKKINRKILSMILVLACLAGVLAIPVFASELYDGQPVSFSSEEGVLNAESGTDPAFDEQGTAEQAEEITENPADEMVADSEDASEGSASSVSADMDTIPADTSEYGFSSLWEEEPEPDVLPDGTYETMEPASPPDSDDLSDDDGIPEEAGADVEKIFGDDTDIPETEPEPAPEPEPKQKTLAEMTDEEILAAGEALLKAAREAANKSGVMDIIFEGEDLELYLRYQEVKRNRQNSGGGRRMLKAASAEITHIYARDTGPLLSYAQAVTEEYPWMQPVYTYVHYDTNTNNAVYCANINRNFVSDTIYEVAGQWKDDEMYSALSYTFDNGVKKLNGLAASKYTTGNSSKDWYATQMAIWGLLHDYGIRDQHGEDAGFDMRQTAPVSGFEDVYTMMHKLYDDAKYFASRQTYGSSEDPYFVLENPDCMLILQGKTDVPFFITSAEEPVYTLDVKNGSTANDATVQLYKKNYTDAQQWELETSDEAGYYYFKNVKSGLYLEVAGNGGANGDDIRQHSKDGSDRQKWKIIAEPDGTVQFAPKVAPNNRIDIRNGVFVNGSNVQLYAANNSKAQKFRCEPADVRVKNLSGDGTYIQTDWIDVEAKGDLLSRSFSLVGAPSGATIVYQNADDPMGKVAVRVPVSSIPAGGQCDFQIMVDAVFNKPTISYLAINDSDAQELLVAGSTVQVTASDRLAVYTVPMYGGVKIYKRDADTKSNAPQGDASLNGAVFEIINKSGSAVLVNGTEYADGKVVKTITTDVNGYAATGEKDLQVGTYLIREKTAPAGYLGTGVTERTFEISAREEGTLVDLTASEKSIHNNVLRGGVKIKKQDDIRKNDSPQGDASLANAEYSIVNKSRNPVTVNGTSYANGKVVLVIKTDAKGVAQSAADALPYGTYEIYESKESGGYRINSSWRQSFTIRENGKIVDLTGKPCDEAAIQGGVKIRKTDADLKKAQAQGGAALTKATFAITNKSKESVYVDGKLYETDAVVKTIQTDDAGIAQTSADILPYGTYEIVEKDPSTGYLLNNSWKQSFQIRENGKIVDLTGSPCEEPVIRGGVKIKKQDDDYKDDAAQGDAALKDSEFTITNRSKASVVVGGTEYAPDADVITIKTDASGTAQTEAGALPYGTYEIRETKPSEGYLLNEDWNQTFEIRDNGKVIDLTGPPCDEKVIRGGVLIEKRDLELDKNEALGGAALSGIEFTVTNSSPLRVRVDGENYEPDDVITAIYTDEDGHASLPENCLPYGTYTIRETKTNESYLLTDGEPRSFTIREDKAIVKIDSGEKDLVFRDQVVRNDFHLNKIADGTNARMGKTAFVITQLKTGEQHVIVTDRNGEYKSKSKVNPHTQNTNGNDFVLEKYAGEDSVIPSEELDYKAGLWFGLGQKGSEAPAQDDLGSLPYGEYRMQELRCESNIGYKLLDIRFYLETDQSVEPVIELGTMTDDVEEKPEIKTSAAANETGAHETQAGKTTTIVDTVTYKNLKPGTEYTMYGILMIVPEGETEAKELLANGEPVKAERIFTPEKRNGTVEMTFVFDSTALAGTKTVVFEEVRRSNLVIAAHADAEDEGQQVGIVDIGTTAVDEESGTHGSEAEKKDVFIDTVSYSGLTPGKKYEVKGILMDADTGKELLVNGKTVTSKQDFVPDKPDGTVEVEFKLDTRDLVGKRTVVFEDLYRDGMKIAGHADIKDENQTVTIVEIGTTALDQKTGTHESEASEKAVFVDTVLYKGLVAGKTYAVKGVLMDADTGKELLVNGKPVRAEKEFTPQKADGSISLEFTLNTKDLGGRTTVVFEDLYQNEKKIASHADIKDENQSITIIEIGTKAKDKVSGTQEAEPSSTTTIVDTVEYWGLVKGKTYVVKGILMDQETGEALKSGNKPITAEKEFKAKRADGSVELEFTFDSSVLAGKSVVVFEELYHDGVKVATHSDLNDKDQTVTFKTPAPEPTPTPEAEPTSEPERPKPTVTPAETPTPSTTLTPTVTPSPFTPSTPTVTPAPSGVPITSSTSAPAPEENTALKASPVRTGDDTPIGRYLLIFAIAGAVGAAAAFYRMKRK